MADAQPQASPVLRKCSIRLLHRKQTDGPGFRPVGQGNIRRLNFVGFVLSL